MSFFKEKKRKTVHMLVLVLSSISLMPVTTFESCGKPLEEKPSGTVGEGYRTCVNACVMCQLLKQMVAHQPMPRVAADVP